MSNLDQQLAEALDAAGIPKTLVWDATPTCPQGHRNEGDDGHGATRKIIGIGEVCPVCYWHGREQATPPRSMPFEQWCAEYERVVKEYTAGPTIPEWHPEWRIGHVRRPKPLSTDATTLLAAVEAWCEREDAGYEVARYAMRREYDDDGMPFIVEPTHFASVGFHAKAEWTAEANSGTEALARALLAALKGGTDG